MKGSDLRSERKYSEDSRPVGGTSGKKETEPGKAKGHLSWWWVKAGRQAGSTADTGVSRSRAVGGDESETGCQEGSGFRLEQLKARWLHLRKCREWKGSKMRESCSSLLRIGGRKLQGQAGVVRELNTGGACSWCWRRARRGRRRGQDEHWENQTGRRGLCGRREEAGEWLRAIMT